jgi:hypothetical protein
MARHVTASSDSRASPDAIIRHCPVFNRAGRRRKAQDVAYAKLEQTNDDLGRELDAAKACSPSWRHNRPGKPIRSRSQERQTRQHRRSVIGNVDLGQAEKIARAILKAIRPRARSGRESDHHHRRATSTAGSYHREFSLLLSVLQSRPGPCIVGSI